MLLRWAGDMRARRMVLGLWIAGCAGTQTGEPSTVKTRQVARAAAEDPVATSEPSPLTLTPATSGTCDPMRLVPYGDETYLSYGIRGTFVRRQADGSLVDLSLHTVLNPGNIVVAIEAILGDDMIVEVGSVEWADGAPGTYFHRHEGVWTDLSVAMQRHIDRVAPWLDGSVLVAGRKFADPSGLHELAVFGGSTAAPPLPEFAVVDSRCRSEFQFTASPDGRILASGRACGLKESGVGAWAVVRWALTGGAVREQLSLLGGDWKPGPVALSGPTRMFATAILGRRSAYRTSVASFDGSAWTLLPNVDGGVEQIEVDGAGHAWLRTSDGRLVEQTADGRWASRDFPERSVRDIGGLGGAWAWVLEDGGGLWVRPAGGKFARASLVTREFTQQQLRAEQVALVGDELWVTVGYDELRQIRGIRNHPCVLLLRSDASSPAPYAVYARRRCLPCSGAWSWSWGGWSCRSRRAPTWRRGTSAGAARSGRRASSTDGPASVRRRRGSSTCRSRAAGSRGTRGSTSRASRPIRRRRRRR